MTQNSDLSSTVLTDALVQVLRTASGVPTIEFEAPPRRLAGGFWAELLAFELRGAPAAWQGGLVARIMPDPWIAAKETAIQGELAGQGFPTPRVLVAGGPDDGLGQAYLGMDLAPGAPMLTGLSGFRATASLPRLARQLPDLLAQTMAQLHRMDIAPVRASLSMAGVGEHGMDDVLAGLRAGAARCGRDDLVAVADWLTAHPPTLAPDVVCHGDLHPFNVLVDADRGVTVLDWSAAVLTPALYDVAFTGLILSEPPVVVPTALRPAIRAAGRMLARRFRRIYSQQADAAVDGASLAWYEGVVCLRALVEVAGWVAAGEADEHPGHPWLLSGPAFSARLAGLTCGPVFPC